MCWELLGCCQWYFQLLKVNKNDTVVVGQIIGSSGTCNISKSIGNHLHLEVSNGGKMINPESIYDKKISDLAG